MTTNAAKGMSAPYSDRAPYCTNRILLMTVITTMDSCVRKLDVPRAITCRRILALSLKLPPHMRKVLLLAR